MERGSRGERDPRRRLEPSGSARDHPERSKTKERREQESERSARAAKPFILTLVFCSLAFAIEGVSLPYLDNIETSVKNKKVPFSFNFRGFFAFLC